MRRCSSRPARSFHDGDGLVQLLAGDLQRHELTLRMDEHTIGSLAVRVDVTVVSFARWTCASTFAWPCLGRPYAACTPPRLAGRKASTGHHTLLSVQPLRQ